MMTLDHTSHTVPRMHVFEDTKAWLSHVAAVEAGIELKRRGQTALQRQWLDEQGWSA